MIRWHFKEESEKMIKGEMLLKEDEKAFFYDIEKNKCHLFLVRATWSHEEL